MPLKYDRFPLNIRLNLEISSPVVLDIVSNEQDISLVCEEDSTLKDYFSKGHETHQVIFEGHLGSYESKASHIIYLKEQLFDMVNKMKKKESFDAYEWKIVDID